MQLRVYSGDTDALIRCPESLGRGQAHDYACAVFLNAVSPAHHIGSLIFTSTHTERKGMPMDADDWVSLTGYVLCKLDTIEEFAPVEEEKGLGE